MRLRVLDGALSICRLPPDAAMPDASGGFYSVTRTARELSIICVNGAEPAGAKCNRDWRALEVEGPLDFALTGILASIASPLAEAGVSIFAISTFDTDYVLVREKDLGSAVDTLQTAGHEVLSGGEVLRGGAEAEPDGS